MIWLAVLLGISIIISMVWSFSEGDSPIQILTFFLIVMWCAILHDISTQNYKPEGPTAMDVYRGKTALQVTYRDSIAIDTVVVFKEDIK